eukprot:TRINITY_DN24181_c1_g1_i1.p1 TRINITY_DN24181_c1_g1~~TRINITY_DN24181_c1_g1_i1.p1  ORF type:complete len:716 (+),score=168.50 TRINITY_DN24181_c1_g1_i1:72-2150(+)
MAAGGGLVLISPAGGEPLPLPRAGAPPLLVGRHHTPALARDTRVSRTHLRCRAAAGGVTVEAAGANATYLRPCGAVEWAELGRGAQRTVRPGDELSLLPLHARPGVRFRVAEAAAAPPAAPAPACAAVPPSAGAAPSRPGAPAEAVADPPSAAEQPPPKRPRRQAGDPAAPAPQPAAGTGDGGSCAVCCGTGHIEFPEGLTDCPACCGSPAPAPAPGRAHSAAPAAAAGQHAAAAAPAAAPAAAEPGPAGGAGSPMAWRLLSVHPRHRLSNAGCVRLADLIFGAPEWVLLCDYMIDLAWLSSALPALSAAKRVMLWGCAKSADLPAPGSGGLPRHWEVRSIACPDRWGCHHSKLAVVSHGQSLRVVVHTANLLYEDNNSKTQGVWWHDFPRRRDETAGAPAPFGADLAEYLTACGWRGAAAELAPFDFSPTDARLVGSVPGRHRGAALSRWGHMKLRSLLAAGRFGAGFEGAPLLAQCSSLGSITSPWLAELTESLSAGCGPDGKQLGAGELRLVWPTAEDVRTSLTGYAAGQSIPGTLKNVSAAALQGRMCRWGGADPRASAAPHLKSYCRYRPDGSLAWSLLSSANLSGAAWGRLEKGGTQLHVMHYELGVLILPPRGAAAAAPGPILAAAGSAAGRAPGACIVPAPYGVPPRPYAGADKPWACDVDHGRPDRFGRSAAGGTRFYGVPQD